ncbi:MAG: hypothetical protein WEC75_02925 [Dehalococcoidia bacterium]
MGDTTNWEFAAVVAAVTMGLGGLLLFTMISTIGAWRVFRLASQASQEAAKASLAVQDAARHLSVPERAPAQSLDLRQTVDQLSALRQEADALMEQQARLQDAVRNLVEARVLGNQEADRHLKDLDGAIQRLEATLGQVAVAVSNLGQRFA